MSRPAPETSGTREPSRLMGDKAHREFSSSARPIASAMPAASLSGMPARQSLPVAVADLWVSARRRCNCFHPQLYPASSGGARLRNQVLKPLKHSRCWVRVNAKMKPPVSIRSSVESLPQVPVSLPGDDGSSLMAACLGGVRGRVPVGLFWSAAQLHQVASLRR